jgi:enoyl-[acyl-carrier protein] reductase/trans-2-enoyl-CoA reductase (NAD+)
MIVAPKIRGFICTTAHPTGCAKHIADQIAVVKGRGPIANGPKKVLVIGSSTGYGLSSRIAAAFGSNAATIGVFFEKPAEADRCGTTGWYNSAAFENEAQAAGLYARSFNGDAFSDAMKTEVIEAIKKDLGQVDCIIYSLASPRRTQPKTGEVFKSVLKPIGSASYTNKNLNTGNGVVNEVTIEPANDDEIAQTIAVMGGEDWEMWIDALLAAGVVAEGTQTVAYSYIGPEVTWPIYKNGTIGRA